MRLASRVAKLETAHRRVLRCTWCRFALRDVPPPVVKRYSDEPDSVMRTRCWYCGTTYVVSLRDLNAHQREALALVYNSHPTKQFTDERVHAALIWSRLYRSEVKDYEKAKQGQTPQPNREHSVTWRDQKAKREREGLEQQALEFCQAQLERFERLANGPEFFPLDETLDRIEQEFPTSGYDKSIDELLQTLGFEKYSQAASSLRSALAICNLHLQNLKKRQACEAVIWRDPLPETAQEIAFFDLEKQRSIDAVAVDGCSVLKVMPVTAPS